MILLVMLGTKYGTIIYVTVFLSCVFHCITVRFMITCIDMKIEEFEIKIVFESGPNSPGDPGVIWPVFVFSIIPHSVNVKGNPLWYDFLIPLTLF